MKAEHDKEKKKIYTCAKLHAHKRNKKHLIGSAKAVRISMVFAFLVPH